MFCPQCGKEMERFRAAISTRINVYEIDDDGDPIKDKPDLEQRKLYQEIYAHHCDDCDITKKMNIFSDGSEDENYDYIDTSF